MQLHIDNLTEDQAKQIQNYLRVVTPDAIVSETAPMQHAPPDVFDEKVHGEIMKRVMEFGDKNHGWRDKITQECYDGNIRAAAIQIAADTGANPGEAYLIATIMMAAARNAVARSAAQMATKLAAEKLAKEQEAEAGGVNLGSLQAAMNAVGPMVDPLGCQNKRTP